MIQLVKPALDVGLYSNRAAVRQFLRQKTGGAVLNMGSVLGSSPSPKYFATHAYAAAKGALTALMTTMASTYLADRIRVNLVSPGLTDTPMATRAASVPCSSGGWMSKYSMP